MPTTRMSGRSALAAVAQPAISPPPPTGASSRSSPGACSSSSRAAVPCPAMTAGCSYGRYEREAALARQRRAQRLAILAVAVVRDHLGAVAAGGVELGGGRVGRHQDHGRRVEHARGDRDGLGVVSRRVRGHAAAARLGGQARDHVVGPAELERTPALQALGLQEHARAGACVERPRGERRACGGRPRPGGRPRRGRRQPRSRVVQPLGCVLVDGLVAGGAVPPHLERGPADGVARRLLIAAAARAPFARGGARRRPARGPRR